MPPCCHDFVGPSILKEDTVSSILVVYQYTLQYLTLIFRKKKSFRLLTLSHLEELLGTIHLRSWQNFHDFDPSPLPSSVFYCYLFLGKFKQFLTPPPYSPKEYRHFKWKVLD